METVATSGHRLKRSRAEYTAECCIMCSLVRVVLTWPSGRFRPLLMGGGPAEQWACGMQMLKCFRLDNSERFCHIICLEWECQRSINFSVAMPCERFGSPCKCVPCKSLQCMGMLRGDGERPASPAGIRPPQVGKSGDWGFGKSRMAFLVCIEA